MGYESDQFYNLDDTSSGESVEVIADGPVGMSSVGSVVTVSNNKFTYPDNIVRGGYTTHNRYVLNEGTGKLDLVKNLDGGVNFDLGTLKKGYIRNLKVDPGQQVTKCQFQFNPSTLNQSVSQNQQVLNFLQQNMSQYAQPMPSNVNFQFQLMFDRSKELNNYNGAVEQGVGTGALWAKTDPSVVGVFHDIGTLYEAIGVGLSDSQQTYMMATLQDQIKGELLEQAQEGATDLQTEADVTAAIAERSNQASKLLNVNRGNTGFLLPIPVRVVFSSLYIVEGLVQNVSVRYVKFTRNLVPMQATVEITLEGKYIGFAKKDTFFSAVLEERRKLRAADIAAANKITQNNAELAKLGQTDFPLAGAAVSGSGTSGSDNTKVGELIDTGSRNAGEREARLRVFPQSSWSNLRSYWSTGEEVTVSFTGTAKLYRIHDSFLRDTEAKSLFDAVPRTFRELTGGGSEPIEQTRSRYAKAQALAAYIDKVESEIDENQPDLDDYASNSNYEIALSQYFDSLVSQGHTVTHTDSAAVGGWYYSACFVREDRLDSEPEFTVFSSYDDIKEKFDDTGTASGTDELGDSLSNDDAKRASSAGGHGRGYGSNAKTGTEIYSELRDDVRWLMLYDINITLTTSDGSTATGVVRDYLLDDNATPLEYYNDFDTKKRMYVDWGDQ